MGFIPIEFPRAISKGSQGGLMHNTLVVDKPSGASERASRWPAPKIRWDVGYGAKDVEALNAIVKHHRLVAARAYSFPFWDPADWTTNPAGRVWNYATTSATPTDESIGTGDGATTDFQLVKRYASGLTTRVRNLTRPEAGTVRVALNGVEQLTGWTVNYDTGVITFATPPANGVAVTAGCKFVVPVVYEDDVLKYEISEFDNGLVVSGINVVEELSNTVIDDDHPKRGASYQSFSAPLSLSPRMGYFVRLNPSGSGMAVDLPGLSNYEQGGPHWKLRNETAFTIAVRHAGSTVFTLQASGDSQRRDFAEVVLGVDAAGAASWLGVT